MDAFKVIDKLENNLELFNTILKYINDNQSKWKPSPPKWSIVEVIHHLYDEEREDFRKRIQFTLEDPNKKWFPINPPQWVIDRKYNEQNLEEVKNKFFNEREKSVKWLRNLKSPTWEIVHIHPKIGSISAGDLLVSWLAHDFLHMRQIIMLNLEFYKKSGEPFSTKYAMP